MKYLISTGKFDKKQTGQFLWRITYAHTIAYFIAGLFAATFMDYKTHYASDFLSHYMLPTDAPMVAVGPALQILRGLIMALVLLPFREVIFSKNGWWKLALLIFGLSQICTIGATPGSFDGMIYTVLPLQYHLLGLPETFAYILLFIGIMALAYKVEKRYINIIAGILLGFIILMGVCGYLAAKGLMPMPQ